MCYDSRMQKKHLIAALIIMIAGLAVWQLWPASRVDVPPLHIDMAQGENVLSWDLQGAYTGNAELMAKADAEINRLFTLFGSKEYSDYILYVSIANQYGLKGDGKSELLYLEKALALDSTTTGLAWYNAGQLFARLGAYQTARVALEKAAAAQPVEQFQRALSDFAAEHPETDKTTNDEGV